MRLDEWSDRRLQLIESFNKDLDATLEKLIQSDTPGDFIRILKVIVNMIIDTPEVYEPLDLELANPVYDINVNSSINFGKLKLAFIQVNLQTIVNKFLEFEQSDVARPNNDQRKLAYQYFDILISRSYPQQKRLPEALAVAIQWLASILEF